MKLAGMFLLTMVLQAPVALQPATVQGTVIDALTSQTLAHATIDLTGVPESPLNVAYVLSRDTGVDGTFNFQNVPPGTYIISVSHSGYLGQYLGENPNAVRPTKRLNPGQTLAGIQIRLMPAAVIYGRLVSDRNEPVVSATVQAVLTRFRDGRRVPFVVQSVTSNDLGEYRLFDLPAGEYHVAVIERRNSLRSNVPWFFPGTINLREAQSINLKPGEIAGGVSFSSVPSRGQKVSGFVQGMNGNAAVVMLASREGDVQMRADANSETGAFSFLSVAPGEYMLVARSAELRATVPLDVGNVDIQGVRISLGPGHRIPVRIRIDGHGEGPDPALEKLYLVARRETEIAGLELDTYSPFAEGRFEFDLITGDYRIEISRGEGYLKSIKLGGVDVLDQGLHVSNSSTDVMEIVVGEDIGSISGRAAVKDATVVLVPDSARRRRQTLYQSVLPGTTGEFTFEKVPPGDYKLFAWQEENGRPWRDPEYLAVWEDRGIPVRVVGNQKTVVSAIVPVN